MRKFIASACFTAVATVGLFAADRTPVTTPVTITGCVQQRTGGSAYVLTNVSQLSPRVEIPADEIYWLNSTKGLKAQVGHKVEVTGLVSENDTKTGKIKVKTAKDGEQKVEVESGGKKAETTLPAPVATSGEKSKSEVVEPVHTLHVESIRMVSATCS